MEDKKNVNAKSGTTQKDPSNFPAKEAPFLNEYKSRKAEVHGDVRQGRRGRPANRVFSLRLRKEHSEAQGDRIR